MIPAYAIKYPVYDNFMKNKTKYFFGEKFYYGYLTGIIQTTATYPIDFLRTRLTLDNKMLKLYKTNLVNYTKHLIKNNGIKSLYNGFSGSILFYPFYIAIQFSIFNYFKEYGYNPLISGGITGMITDGIMYPSDIIRRQLQINGVNETKKKYSGIINCINKIYIKEGINGFYKGFGINLFKSIPEAAIQFAVYEYCKEIGLTYL